MKLWECVNMSYNLRQPKSFLKSGLRKRTVDLDACHYRKHSQAQLTRARELLAPSPFHKGAAVLDVGCGEGTITAEIASLVPNGKVIGIDASPNMVTLASNTFCLPNLEFGCVKAEEACFSELFDYIVCFSCLLWVRKPKQALSHLSKLLKRGGRLLILTYLKDSSYVDLLEKTLDEYPAYKKLSAARTMLSAEEHLNILESNRLEIQTFEIRDLVSSYTTREELKHYLKGWLESYVPIPERHQNEFLERAVQNSLSFSLHPNGWARTVAV
jgi:ubiquinone/menaquinone biosynthesis C-methylase UbiE